MGRKTPQEKPYAYVGHGGDDPEGIKKLWWAVCVQAAQDLSDFRYRVGAACWFLSSNQRVGSFQWICDHTGLNEAVIRRAVMASGWTPVTRRTLEGKED